MTGHDQPAAQSLDRRGIRRWWCDACGIELTPTAEDWAHVRWFGVGREKSPCWATENGRHICEPVAVSMGLQLPGGGYAR